MSKKLKAIELWWNKLETTPANPAVVWWILLAWFVLCAVVLYKCG